MAYGVARRDAKTEWTALELAGLILALALWLSFVIAALAIMAN